MVRSSSRTPILSCKGVGVFKSLQPKGLDRIAAASTMLDIPRGGTSSNGFDPDTSVVIVCKGILALQHTLSDGRRSLTELFCAGDILDPRRMGRRFQGDLACLTKARILALNAKVLDEICLEDPQVHVAVQERHREQMHILRDHCVDIGKKTPNERIASFIFEQLNRISGRAEGETLVKIPLSKKSIGEYLALRSETVSRACTHLVEAGLISFPSRNFVRILDIRGLRQISNGSMPRSCKGNVVLSRVA